MNDPADSNGGAGARMIFNKTVILIKTAGVGTTTFIDNALNNTGIVNVTSGTLALEGGDTDTGTFNVGTGDLLTFDGGTHTRNGGAASFGETGVVSLFAGALASGPAGAGFTVSPTATFQWDGGAIRVPVGATLLSKGIVSLVGSSDQELTGGGTLKLAGSINQAGLGSAGLDLTGGSTVTYSGIYTGPDAGQVQLNAGTIWGGGGSAGATLNFPAGLFRWNSLTGGSWAAYSTPTIAATLTIASASTITAIGLAATAILSGPNAAFSNLAGLATNFGTLELPNGQSFTTAGGFSNANQVILNPGSVPTVAGKFTQFSAATLTIQIGGTASAPTVGSIAIATGGAVSLNGTLTLSDSVTPRVGTVLEILTRAGAGPSRGPSSASRKGQRRRRDGEMRDFSRRVGQRRHPDHSRLGADPCIPSRRGRRQGTHPLPPGKADQ